MDIMHLLIQDCTQCGMGNNMRITEIYKIPQSEFSEIDLKNIIDYWSVIKRSKI